MTKIVIWRNYKDVRYRNVNKRLIINEKFFNLISYNFSFKRNENSLNY